MRLSAIRLKNYRRFTDTAIALDNDLTIFVGPNNSGKTSVTHAIHAFTGDSTKTFSLYDFNAASWPGVATVASTPTDESSLPTTSIDLWFTVAKNDLHLVLDLLPRLQWKGSMVGVRIQFGPKNPAELLKHYLEVQATASASKPNTKATSTTYTPWPEDLFDYLKDRLSSEYERRFFVLDEAQFTDYRENTGYAPPELTPAPDSTSQGATRSGLQVVQSLIRVDYLNAQRHLSDSQSLSRAESLSACLGRFYTRHLKQWEQDHEAMRALADSKDGLNQHLAAVFKSVMDSLAKLGYPGVANPKLHVRSTLAPHQIFAREGTAVHYELDGVPAAAMSLPDNYNGLGFKNLIYMVVEILDYQEQWATDIARPPLHLLIIEEPEAHLHAQLQQVFVREVLKLLRADGDYATQLILTTHSSHITFERGFLPLRYFKRIQTVGIHSTDVLNVSQFYAQNKDTTGDFLQRYMKLTHCDLFFADAAVLVEGTVERLLLPSIIERDVRALRRCYISILEIGGAYGHRFRELIRFLGVPALIVTDIDSVAPSASPSARPGSDDDDGYDTASACPVGTPGAVTSNQVLAQWLPKLSKVTDLLAADDSQCTEVMAASSVRVVYQRPTNVSWNNKNASLTGRTFEEAFALDNLQWCQAKERADLALRIRGADSLSPDELATKIHKKVTASSFAKVDFALALLNRKETEWSGPAYIVEGLKWLDASLAPHVMSATAARSAAKVTS